jgi:hypothetical protein
MVLKTSPAMAPRMGAMRTARETRSIEDSFSNGTGRLEASRLKPT